MVVELAELAGLIETDQDLNVVVFDSANPAFYLAHYDVEGDPGASASLPTGPTGVPAWPQSSNPCRSPQRLPPIIF